MVLPVIVCAVGLALAGCGSSTTAESTPGATTDAGTTRDGEPTATAVDMCAVVTVDEVAAIVGGSGELRPAPADSCEFHAEAREVPNVTFGTLSLSEGSGGFDGYRSGAEGSITGTARDLDGVGDKAFVIAGMAAGDYPSAGGAASVKGLIVSVNLAGPGMAVPVMDEQIEKLLRLAVSKV